MGSGDERVEADLPIGFRVGDYVVRESVASGGFGSVYRVEHVTNGTHAALKVLHAELGETPEAVQRFELEVGLVRDKLRHPNVVEILGSGRLEDGRPYFVMELLIGVDLETHVRSRRRLPPTDMLAILEALCSALTLAHEQNIIHRDLKASNVFLSAHEGKRRVVLLDFGVAKIIGDDGPGLTAAGHVVGTPSCMAPEQVLGRPTDARTDVYALGVLSYYMLTGELPFHDPNAQTVQYMHLSVLAPKPSAVAPVGAMFDDVILRALSKKPMERPSSAAEFLAEFRAAVTGTEAPTSQQYDRRMLALYIQVGAAPEALEDGDDDLYTDMAECLPFAQKILVQKGFILAVLMGSSRLFLKELPTEGGREVPARREAVRTALALERQLGHRATFDERVDISLCLHVGTVQVAGGKVVDGELLQVSAWTPKKEWKGVVGTPQVFADLPLVTQAVSGLPEYLRVVEGTGPGPGPGPS